MSASGIEHAQAEVACAQAEVACAYVADRVRRGAGARWLQGNRRPPLACRVASPIVRLFAEKRMCRVADAAAQGLVAWAQGERAVTMFVHVPEPREVLTLQARGRRCVSLLADGVSTSPHASGLEFILHDLCHLEKFVAKDHYVGAVGFFASLERAIAGVGWRSFEGDLDEAWRCDLDHVAADMNGSAIFLLAALKMKLKMAARRRIARERGIRVEAATCGGPLDVDEQRAYADRLDALLELLGLDAEARDAARRVSTRRDAPGPAQLLLEWFERRGAAILADHPAGGIGQGP